MTMSKNMKWVHAGRSALKSAAALVVIAGLAFSWAPAQAAEDDTIFIGGVLSETGIQAQLDAPALLGARLAVKHLNATGGVLGKNVKFVNYDGKSDPTVVASNASRLVAQGADLMIVPADFDMGGPGNRVAQRAGIVGMSVGGSSPLHGSATLGDLQFTISMWNTVMGSAAAEFAYEKKGWDTAYVVTDTFIDYTTSLSEYFIKHFEALGGEVIYEDKYTQGAQDFSAQLARMQSKMAGKDVDVLFISSYMPDLGTIIRAIRQAGIDLPIMGGDSYDSQSLFKALGERYGNDIYFAGHSYMASGVADGMSDFLKLFEEEYGEPPKTAFTATGWDTVMAMAKAVEIAGTTDGKAVAEALEENEFNLLSGVMDWSSAATGHEPTKSVAMVEIQDGETSFIGWLTPHDVPTPPYLQKFIELHSAE